MTRIKLAVYVNLDNMPGVFHSADSARNSIANLLNNQIPHYAPAVSIESYDTEKDHGEPIPDVPSRYVFDGVIVETMQEADALIDSLRQQFQDFSRVTVDDLYSTLGLEVQFPDHHWGWTDMSSFEITQGDNNVKISFARPTEIR